MTMQAMCTRAPAGQLLGVVAQATGTAQAAATGEPGAGPTEFRPVQGGGNIASGEVLLVEAYAAMWLLALGLVLLTIFKQRRLDSRIDQLSADIERARQQQARGASADGMVAAEDG